MSIEIIPFTKGIAGSFLVKDNSYALVDTGINITREGYLKRFNNQNISPKDVKIIIITHGHADHFAGISILKELTGAKILCHSKANFSLQTGKSQEVKARSFAGKIQKKLFNMELKEYIPIEADILINDEYDLSVFGINGKIICTPGHTDCSISLVLESHESISGDLLVGISKKPSLSPFAVNEKEMIQSINKLMHMNVEVNYCGHGGVHKRKEILKLIDKYRS